MCKSQYFSTLIAYRESYQATLFKVTWSPVGNVELEVKLQYMLVRYILSAE